VANGNYLQYTIRPGDNLSTIAAQYHTTVEALVAVTENNIANPNEIEKGKTLYIPTNSTGTHTVKSGETATAIARRYGTTVPVLESLNPTIVARNEAAGKGRNLNYLDPKLGDKLNLPVTSTPTMGTAAPAPDVPKNPPANVRLHSNSAQSYLQSSGFDSFASYASEPPAASSDPFDPSNPLGYNYDPLAQYGLGVSSLAVEDKPYDDGERCLVESKDTPRAPAPKQAVKVEEAPVDPDLQLSDELEVCEDDSSSALETEYVDQSDVSVDEEWVEDPVSENPYEFQEEGAVNEPDILTFDPNTVSWPDRNEPTYMEESFAIITMEGYLSSTTLDSWLTSPGYAADIERIREDFGSVVLASFTHLVQEGITDPKVLADYGQKLDTMQAEMLSDPVFKQKLKKEGPRDAVLDYYKRRCSDNGSLDIYRLEQDSFAVGIDEMLETGKGVGNCTVCTPLVAYSLMRMGLKVQFMQGDVSSNVYVYNDSYDRYMQDYSKSKTNGHTWLKVDGVEIETTGLTTREQAEAGFSRTSEGYLGYEYKNEQNTGDSQIVAMNNEIGDLIASKNYEGAREILDQSWNLLEANDFNSVFLCKNYLNLSFNMAMTAPKEERRDLLSQVCLAAAIMCRFNSDSSLAMDAFTKGLQSVKYSKADNKYQDFAKLLKSLDDSISFSTLTRGTGYANYVQILVTDSTVESQEEFYELLSPAILLLQPKDLSKGQWEDLQDVYTEAGMGLYTDTGNENAVANHIAKCLAQIS